MSSVVRILVGCVVWGNTSVVVPVKVDLRASVVRFSMVVIIHVTHWLNSDMVRNVIIVCLFVSITMSIVGTTISRSSVSMREILMETSDVVYRGVVDRCSSTQVAGIEVVLFLSSGSESDHSSDDVRSHDV